ncbi:hypothetical protein [Actinomadura sp. 9N407]|uniref:hypothetical protein n=1 Tax=Actinomadura sp. 9N407 TaxID=3375154 RepID=UPI0037940930
MISTWVRLAWIRSIAARPRIRSRPDCYLRGVQPVLHPDLGGDVGVLAGDAAQVGVHGVHPAPDDHRAHRTAVHLVADHPLQLVAQPVPDAERAQPVRGGQRRSGGVAEPFVAEDAAGALQQPVALRAVQVQEAMVVHTQDVLQDTDRAVRCHWLSRDAVKHRHGKAIEDHPS